MAAGKAVPAFPAERDLLMKLTRSSKDNIAGWIFIAPCVLGLGFFTAFPIILSFIYSLTDYQILQFNAPLVWNNFANYINIFHDEKFLDSFRLTFLFAFVSVFISLVLSFVLALLLNTKLKGIKAFRVLIYTPCIIPAVASAAIWKDLFNATNAGLINRMFAVFGLGPFTWFSSVDTALGTMVLLSLWGLGGNMLMWIAGFNSVSPVYYEAAELDGANALTKMFRITIPLVSPVIFYNLIVGIIGAFQSFGSAYLLTDGGPLDSTNFLALHIYRIGITKGNMGYASSMAWIMFLVIMALTALAFLSSGWVYYGDEDKKRRKIKT